MKLLKEIEAFKPWNQQEKQDKKELIRQLGESDRIFDRSNLAAHMTASAWVVNENRDKVLMAYHNIYNSWSWLGGHADGETDLLSVAMREAMEESGISRAVPAAAGIFSLEILTVDGHEKNGVYVSSHLHLNVTYLLEADEQEALTPKLDENTKVAWFALDDAVKASTEPWFRERIYTKLNEKLRKQDKNCHNCI